MVFIKIVFLSVLGYDKRHISSQACFKVMVSNLHPGVTIDDVQVRVSDSPTRVQVRVSDCPTRVKVCVSDCPTRVQVRVSDCPTRLQVRVSDYYHRRVHVRVND